MTIQSLLDETLTNLNIQQLSSDVFRLVQKIQLDMVSTKKRSENYCINFVIPEKEVLNIFNKIEPGLTDKINVNFKSDWNTPDTALMVNSAYYHVLLFIIIIGIKVSNDILAQNALNLLNFRLYNGRRVSSIPHCDPNVMLYVLQNMMSKKFEAPKHETPFELITQYFTPTIYKKYKSYIQRDVKESKRLFHACFNRIRQIFRSDRVADLNSGEIKYRSGLQPLYFKAKEKNLKISTTVSNSETGIETTLTSNSIEENIDSITNYIVMNHQPIYTDEFIDFLKTQSSAQKSAIQKILLSLHSLTYSDSIHEILEFMFKRISINIVCTPNFMDDIKNKIISSKHTADINKIKDISDLLLKTIFDKQFGIEFEKYSTTNRAQLRRIIIYGLAYNIQKYKCH
jgi:hypothetical protein